MRALSLVYLIFLVITSIAFVPAHASDPSVDTQISPIVPPAGLGSVNGNPVGMAVAKRAVDNSALRVADVLMVISDLDKIQKGEAPEERRFVVVLTPTDSQLRFANEKTYSAIVGDMRRRFLRPEEISHANAHMKAKGERSELISTDGNRILVDEANCFAVATLGRYKIDRNSNAPPVALGVAYVRIKGQLFILQIVSAGKASEDKTWLANDIPAWLRSLPTGD